MPSTARLHHRQQGPAVAAVKLLLMKTQPLACTLATSHRNNRVGRSSRTADGGRDQPLLAGLGVSQAPETSTLRIQGYHRDHSSVQAQKTNQSPWCGMDLLHTHADVRVSMGHGSHPNRSTHAWLWSRLWGSWENTHSHALEGQGWAWSKGGGAGEREDNEGAGPP